MDNKQGRAVSGSLLGGVVGGFLGMSLGGFLGPLLAGVERHPEDSLLGLFDSCFGFFFALTGAAIGGVVCAVAGAACGAGLATSPNRTPADAPVPPPNDLPPVGQESTATELAALREKIAAIEARKHAKDNAGGDGA